VRVKFLGYGIKVLGMIMFNPSFTHPCAHPTRVFILPLTRPSCPHTHTLSLSLCIQLCLFFIVVAIVVVVVLPSLFSLQRFYYLQKQILPALARVLNIAGLDPHRWFADMARPRMLRAPLLVHRRSEHATMLLNGLGFWTGGSGGGGSGGGWGGDEGNGGMLRPPPQQQQQQVLTAYLLNDHCLLCDARCKQAVCEACKRDPFGKAHSVALAKLAHARKAVAAVKALCGNCMGVNSGRSPWQGGVPLVATPSSTRMPPSSSSVGATAMFSSSTMPSSSSSSSTSSGLLLGEVAPHGPFPWRPTTAAACVSLDCPVLFKRMHVQEDLRGALDLADALCLLE
jgi:hypothetical protein